MRRENLLLIFLFAFTYVGKAQQAKPSLNDPVIQTKLFNARETFYSGNYRLALSAYQELDKAVPGDGNVIYYLGLCHLYLNEASEALQYFERAKGIKENPHSDLRFGLGRAYYFNGRIDEAIIELLAFRGTLTSLSKTKAVEVDKYLDYCVNAKELMANPIDVKIENIGKKINTPSNDNKPCYIPGQGALLFSSSINNNPSLPRDSLNTEIFLTKQDPANKDWSRPAKNENVNTRKENACVGISPDGKKLFLRQNNRDKSTGSEIYISDIIDQGNFSKPKSIGKAINSEGNENAVCISPDGTGMYFISDSRERKGAIGKGDIYVVKKKGNKWGEPENMGAVINSEEDEASIFLMSDGKTLLFSSKGHKSMGSYDIFKTTFEAGQWSKPVNMGYPLNSVFSDNNLIIDESEQSGYFVSDRPGGFGGDDIYKVNMSGLFIDNVKRN